MGVMGAVLIGTAGSLGHGNYIYPKVFHEFPFLPQKSDLQKHIQLIYISAIILYWMRETWLLLSSTSEQLV